MSHEIFFRRHLRLFINARVQHRRTRVFSKKKCHKQVCFCCLAEIWICVFVCGPFLFDRALLYFSFHLLSVQWCPAHHTQNNKKRKIQKNQKKNRKTRSPLYFSFHLLSVHCWCPAHHTQRKTLLSRNNHKNTKKYWQKNLRKTLHQLFWTPKRTRFQSMHIAAIHNTRAFKSFKK